MQDKVVLITGAKGGLGTNVTQAFLRAGASVAGTSRSIKQSDFPQPNFFAVAGDISEANGANEVVQSTLQNYGRVDALVHVMGGFEGGKRVDETDDATWERMRDLNLSSGFYIARAVLPHMRAAGRGRIIAIGSLSATEPHSGISAYVVFKTALATLFRTIALENAGSGITSNIILPGTMDTPANRAAMPSVDPAKWVQPEDVARLILWLAGDEAAQVNGAVIPVYGRDV
jgi:NAD(P)-dependent dehydrogenase (short-subunit alcohol dehydrogenase family)